MEQQSACPSILVAGATGYVGSRLIRRLLTAGYRVRALARTPAKITGRPWAAHERLEVVQGDVLDLHSLSRACRGCRAAYYLVHSMNPANADFAAADRSAARNMATAAAAASLQRIIYLGGLGEAGDALSPHLRSRAEVAAILRAGPVPVTVLRAAMIIGSGSASFEILRYLVERLPIIFTPRWVDTPCQPIGIRNVLFYLLGCLECEATVGETFDIGQPEVVTYRRLMELFAEEAGLRRRLIIPLPWLSTRVSAYLIHLITPVPAVLARPLAEGLRNRVVCRDMRLYELLPQPLLDCREAIRRALQRMREHDVESSWRDAGRIPPAEWATPDDPVWAGGTRYDDCRRIDLAANVDEVWKAVIRIGGTAGWYHADLLWSLRGGLDRLAGGIGLQRGRRCPVELYPGDALDCWRASRVERPYFLQLVAEMKMPGQAILEFRLSELAGEGTRVELAARFIPRGMGGILYWHAVAPLHHLVFNGLLRGLGQRLQCPVLRGPQRVSP
jgi:uncharacterized protein YbjT (DUF2867 family)